MCACVLCKKVGRALVTKSACFCLGFLCRGAALRGLETQDLAGFTVGASACSPARSALGCPGAKRVTRPVRS